MICNQHLQNIKDDLSEQNNLYLAIKLLASFMKLSWKNVNYILIACVNFGIYCLKNVSLIFTDIPRYVKSRAVFQSANLTFNILYNHRRYHINTGNISILSYFAIRILFLKIIEMCLLYITAIIISPQNDSKETTQRNRTG